MITTVLQMTSQLFPCDHRSKDYQFDMLGHAEPDSLHGGHVIGALWTCPVHSRHVQSVLCSSVAICSCPAAPHSIARPRDPRAPTSRHIVATVAPRAPWPFLPVVTRARHPLPSYKKLTPSPPQALQPPQQPPPHPPDPAPSPIRRPSASSPPTLCFSMYICAKQAQMETRSPLVHPGTTKAIGVDLLVPPIVYPPRYSPDGGSPVDICLGLCLVRS